MFGKSILWVVITALLFVLPLTVIQAENAKTDEEWTIDDARIVLQYIVGKITLSDDEILRLKQSDGDLLGIDDARIILQKMVGKWKPQEPVDTDPDPLVAPPFIPVYSSSKDFETAAADFAVELLKKSYKDGKNTLISPLSVLLALAMTANGAEDETLAQMEQVLGGLTIDELNVTLRSYVNSLPSGEKAMLHIANSIWFRDDPGLTVKPAFLQTNTHYFNAEVRCEPFNAQTVEDINNWVKSNTDGMIDKLLDRLDPDVVLCLINAMAFDAEWRMQYVDKEVRSGDFHAAGGALQTVDFLHSEEYLYLTDENATGFLKQYAGNRYAFAALLPNEDLPLAEYVAGLTGADWQQMLGNACDEGRIIAAMPKFSFDFDRELNDDLIEMGMPRAFNEYGAQFGKMAKSNTGNIFISQVIHKTFIDVNQVGTRAGAVTVVYGKSSSVPPPPKYQITLDRPFVFAIVDMQAGLPLFIGAVNDVA